MEIVRQRVWEGHNAVWEWEDADYGATETLLTDGENYFLKYETWAEFMPNEEWVTNDKKEVNQWMHDYARDLWRGRNRDKQVKKFLKMSR